MYDPFIFRVKNKKMFLIISFFFTNILSQWFIKEVKRSYKNEKINPFQKKKGEWIPEPPRVVIRFACSFSDFLDRLFFIFFLSSIYIYFFFIFLKGFSIKEM